MGVGAFGFKPLTNAPMAEAAAPMGSDSPPAADRRHTPSVVITVDDKLIPGEGMADGIEDGPGCERHIFRYFMHSDVLIM